jgi:hypothetical protein
MHAYELKPGYRIQLGDHSQAPKLTVTASAAMWNGNIAVMFAEIPMTFYFRPLDRFNVIPAADWHNDPDVHSYR